MNQNDIAAEHRRLAILKLLKASDAYRMGDEMLQECLERLGKGASLTVIRADLSFLQRVGVIGVTDVGGNWLALLRQEGVDVVGGHAAIPGIARPRPEE